ncbi:MAG: SDR family NAD(P)-dependent oxidoreductase [Chloroflexota bacterium]
MNNFEGKIVLITGAGNGLGRSLLTAFANQGAWVAANDLTNLNFSDELAEINSSGGHAQEFLSDVSKKLSVQTTIREVIQDWDRIDILVNHASVQPMHPFLNMDEWDWRRTIDVNLTGTFIMAQSVARVMRELGGGVILNVGPVKDEDKEKAYATRSAYLAAKAGVVAFTQAVAKELTEHNISMNAICPSKSNLGIAVEESLALCTGEQTGQIVNC